MSIGRNIVEKLRESKVGAFYMIGDKILSNAVKVSQGDQYGDFVNYSSHWDLWKALCRYYPQLKRYEYSDFPRGRVVFNKKTRKFIVYIDKKLKNNTSINKICKEYGLGSSNYEINDKDEHYDSLRTGHTIKFLESDIKIEGNLKEHVKCDTIM